MAEIGEDIEIKPHINILWALWIIIRLLLTIWWRNCFVKWLVELKARIVKLKEKIHNKNILLRSGKSKSLDLEKLDEFDSEDLKDI